MFLSEERERREEKAMLKEAEKDYLEIDLARQTQSDPFAKDKVLRIESMQAAK